MQTPTTQVSVFQDGNTVRLRVGGLWSVQQKNPDIQKLLGSMQGVKVLVCENAGIEAWDSALPVFLRSVVRYCKEREVELDLSALPEGVARLMELAVLAPVVGSGNVPRESFLAKVGNVAIAMWAGLIEYLSFVGESSIALLRVVAGRGVFRWKDFWVLLEDCGPKAFMIVGLISFLVGLIMAFVGSVQLAPFGADIYVANLVGVAMVREMGAMMCAIVMAGRTGAAFAAQIGSMKVTEEIDALKTLGVSPVEFLVVPRMLALFFMMPFLAAFADFIGIVGGMVVALAMLDVTLVQYINQTAGAITVLSFSLGILKASVFGVIVAVAGCLRGMQCGNSSSAVGDASTSAVVTAMTLIIIADAVFAVIFNILGI